MTAFSGAHLVADAREELALWPGWRSPRARRSLLESSWAGAEREVAQDDERLTGTLSGDAGPEHRSRVAGAVEFDVEALHRRPGKRACRARDQQGLADRPGTASPRVVRAAMAGSANNAWSARLHGPRRPSASTTNHQVGHGLEQRAEAGGSAGVAPCAVRATRPSGPAWLREPEEAPGRLRRPRTRRKARGHRPAGRRGPITPCRAACRCCASGRGSRRPRSARSCL